jgi:hypothetical protein
LTFSGEVQWFHFDQKMSGSSVFTATAPKPTTLYVFKDQDTFLLQVRAQRNFRFNNLAKVEIWPGTGWH